MGEQKRTTGGEEGGETGGFPKENSVEKQKAVLRTHGPEQRPHQVSIDHDLPSASC